MVFWHERPLLCTSADTTKCFTLLLAGLLFVLSHFAMPESACFSLFSFWLDFLVLPVVRLWVLRNWSRVYQLGLAG